MLSLSVSCLVNVLILHSPHCRTPRMTQQVQFIVFMVSIWLPKPQGISVFNQTQVPQDSHQELSAKHKLVTIPLAPELSINHCVYFWLLTRKWVGDLQIDAWSLLTPTCVAKALSGAAEAANIFNMAHVAIANAILFLYLLYLFFKEN